MSGTDGAGLHVRPMIRIDILCRRKRLLFSIGTLPGGDGVTSRFVILPEIDVERTMTGADPYSIHSDTVLAPPVSFRKRLRFLGPGFILSASIVGSGELIATTRLGAEAGWVTLWVILVSCLVKVTVQLEFGKQAIYSGETTMEALNALPGPRFGKANWTIWTWLLLMAVKFLQVGGIVGGTALILAIVAPGIPLALWCYLMAVVVSLIIYRGHYLPIERISFVLIGLFTLLTVASVVALQFTPLSITAPEIWSGLQFRLPPEAVFVAIGAFGITGVGGDEIMAYNYWLIEKGYAAHTGPRERTEAWRERARGWIRVMVLDAVLSMVVYTAMTAAFYPELYSIRADKGARKRLVFADFGTLPVAGCAGGRTNGSLRRAD